MTPVPTTPRRRPLRTIATAAAVLLLVSLLAVETCHESRTRTASLTDLMREEARGVADVVAHVAADAHSSDAAAEQLSHIVAILSTCSRIRYIDLRGPWTTRTWSCGSDSTPNPCAPCAARRRSVSACASA